MTSKALPTGEETAESDDFCAFLVAFLFFFFRMEGNLSTYDGRESQITQVH